MTIIYICLICRLYIAHLCRQSGNQYTNGAGTRFYAYIRSTCCPLGHETREYSSKHLQLSLSVLTHSACVLCYVLRLRITLHTFLADFGLGRLLNHTRIYGTATKFAGTPGFQAPEKLRGESVTTGVDIYGILLELFTGVPLYKDMDPHTIMFKVCVKNIFPDVQHVPPKLQPILKQCLCNADCRISSTKLLELLLDI